MKHGRLEILLKKRLRARSNGKAVPQAAKTAQVTTEAERQVIQPGIDKDPEERYRDAALFTKAVCAFDRLILERCYTFEGLLEVIETWRSHGMSERQIWLQTVILHARKKQMKYEPRLDFDPRAELLKYYDDKAVHRIFNEHERNKRLWEKRSARRRRERKERRERERLARQNTGSVLPNATNTTRSRPSTAA